MIHDPTMLTAPPRAPVSCISFKRHHAGSLVGFADFHYPAARLKLLGCTVHTSHGKRWVALAAKAQLDRDRRLVTDADGKPKYVPVVQWDDEAVREAFSDRAVAALLSYDPSAFDEPEGRP